MYCVCVGSVKSDLTPVNRRRGLGGGFSGFQHFKWKHIFLQICHKSRLTKVVCESGEANYSVVLQVSITLNFDLSVTGTPIIINIPHVSYFHVFKVQNVQKS